MASSPKLSYRNVAAIPPKTIVTIHVDVPLPIRNNSFHEDVKYRNLSEDYILRCFAQAMYLAGEKFVQNEWKNYFMHSYYEEALGTFVYEDTTLREMESPDNASYKKLEANLKWIADKLLCNISVFVGHIETCENYIKTVYEQAIADLKYFTSLPTIFLIIACRGNDLANQLNTESQYDIFRQNRIAFFGFEDLLHIHEGEIYSTKLFDVSRSKGICDSEEMVELFKKFDDELDKAGIQAKLPLNPQEVLGIFRRNPDLEIFHCCRTKLGALYTDFVKGLARRQTTKYPKEYLAQKFSDFLDSTSKVLSSSYTTITSADGIDCDKNDCDIPNPYEIYQTQVEEYNKKGEYHALFRELKSYIHPGYIYSNLQYQSKEEFEEGVQQFFRRIQGLKGKQMSVFTYTPNFEQVPPILFDLVLEASFSSPEYPLFKTIRFILQKYAPALDFTLKDPINERSFLHEILYSKKFTENEELLLFKTLYDSLPNTEEREKVFFLKDKSGNTPISMKNNFRPLLCLFYIEKFGSKLKTVDCVYGRQSGNLLFAALQSYIPEEPNEKELLLLKCILGLLSVGVDPNEKIKKEEYNYKYPGYLGKLVKIPTKKPLEYYAEIYYPPYNSTLFTYFLRYGMTNDSKFFSEYKQFYEGLLASEKKMTSFVKVATALKQFINEFEDDYARDENYNQYGGMPRRYNYNSPNNYSNNTNYNNYRETRITGRLTQLEKEEYGKKREKILDTPTPWTSFKENIEAFLNSPAKTISNTVALFTSALQLRKGMKKHGSKVRRTYKLNKRNLNKTIRNKFNSIQWNINGEKMIGDYLGKILELAKRKEFTKEEKANYKKRPISIQKSELQPREKYNALKQLYEQMEEVLKTR